MACETCAAKPSPSKPWAASYHPPERRLLELEAAGGIHPEAMERVREAVAQDVDEMRHLRRQRDELAQRRSELYDGILALSARLGLEPEHGLDAKPVPTVVQTLLDLVEELENRVEEEHSARKADRAAEVEAARFRAGVAERLAEVLDLLERGESRGLGQTTAQIRLARSRAGSVLLAASLAHAEGLRRMSLGAHLREGGANPAVLPVEDAVRLRDTRGPVILEHFAAQTLLAEAARALRHGEPAEVGIVMRGRALVASHAGRRRNGGEQP